VSRTLNAGRSLFQQSFRSLHKRASRIDQIVDDEQFLPSPGDDVHHLGHVHIFPRLSMMAARP